MAKGCRASVTRHNAPASRRRIHVLQRPAAENVVPTMPLFRGRLSKKDATSEWFNAMSCITRYQEDIAGMLSLMDNSFHTISLMDLNCGSRCAFSNLKSSRADSRSRANTPGSRWMRQQSVCLLRQSLEWQVLIMWDGFHRS